MRAAHDADRSNEKVTISHVFSDTWDTNGYLPDRPVQFNMALAVVDDDKVDFAVYEPGSDTRLTALEINSGAGSTSAFDIRINRPPRHTETLYIKLQAGNGDNRAPFAATVNGEAGRRGGYYFWHWVTPANWDQPIRVKLTMADQIGGTGSYDLGLALTRSGPTVRRTVPVSYSPSAMGLVAARDGVGRRRINCRRPRRPAGTGPAAAGPAAGRGLHGRSRGRRQGAGPRRPDPPRR